MTTKVIFRRTTTNALIDEVIAVFPAMAGDCNPYTTCLSYVHMGQHGVMAIDYMKDTSPANFQEYYPLMKELESIGYDDLQVAKRFSHKDLQARINQTDGK